MSFAGTANTLVIETRRSPRAKTGSLQKHQHINTLQAGSGTISREVGKSEGSEQSDEMFRPGAKTGVPFRERRNEAHLDPAFVTQLLAQAMPDRAMRRSGLTAAYQQLPLPTVPVYDRRF